MVLRIDLVGLRLYEDAFLDQVEEGLSVGSMYQRPGFPADITTTDRG